MDVFTAIQERRSCRAFLPDPISDEDIGKILQAAVWAPSPMNAQPWRFIVITSPELKGKIHAEVEERRNLLLEKSGWKWLGRYHVDFLLSAPAIIAVVGDPDKTGADRFLEGGGLGYQHACCAAIQNMLLAAHALGLGSLWFSLFDPNAMREMLGVDASKVVVALICLGKPAGDPLQTPRKDAIEKTAFIR